MHRVDRLEHLPQKPLLGTPHGDHDAELGRARVARRPGRRDDVIEVQEREHVDTGLEPGGLRAERAVLGARARLGVDEALELDLGPAVGESHAVRERDHVGQLLEGERRHRRDLVAGQWTALVEQGTRGGGEGHAGLRSVGRDAGERRGSTGRGAAPPVGRCPTSRPPADAVAAARRGGRAGPGPPGADGRRRSRPPAR